MCYYEPVYVKQTDVFVWKIRNMLMFLWTKHFNTINGYAVIHNKYETWPRNKISYKLIQYNDKHVQVEWCLKVQKQIISLFQRKQLVGR